MKFELGKNCNLYIYPWHSINLIPSIGFYNVANDDKIDQQTGCQGWDGTIVGRCVDILFFGIVINFMYPNNKFKPQNFGKVYGPVWSRKQKRWYKVRY